MFTHESKVYIACNFSWGIEAEGLLEVRSSHVRRGNQKRLKISMVTVDC